MDGGMQMTTGSGAQPRRIRGGHWGSLGCLAGLCGGGVGPLTCEGRPELSGGGKAKRESHLVSGGGRQGVWCLGSGEGAG